LLYWIILSPVLDHLTNRPRWIISDCGSHRDRNSFVYFSFSWVIANIKANGLGTSQHYYSPLQNTT